MSSRTLIFGSSASPVRVKGHLDRKGGELVQVLRRLDVRANGQYRHSAGTDRDLLIVIGLSL